MAKRISERQKNFFPARRKFYAPISKIQPHKWGVPTENGILSLLVEIIWMTFEKMYCKSFITCNTRFVLQYKSFMYKFCWHASNGNEIIFENIPVLVYNLVKKQCFCNALSRAMTLDMWTKSRSLFNIFISKLWSFFEKKTEHISKNTDQNLEKTQ